MKLINEEVKDVLKSSKFFFLHEGFNFLLTKRDVACMFVLAKEFKIKEQTKMIISFYLIWQ